MTPLEQLKTILSEKYITEDEDEYEVKLLSGLSNEQIDKMASLLPLNKVPIDIRELLLFASGFTFLPIEEVTFDGIGQFGFEEVFPYSVQLAGDGFGNFWVLDIDSKGNWGDVFYVCHDPAVIVKHSANLSEFIGHVSEFGKKGNLSNLDVIHEQAVYNIWKQDNGFIDITEARKSNDSILKEFAQRLSDNYVIADLRNKPNQSGFAWGKFGPNSKIVRCGNEPLWGIEKKTKSGFFSKLFRN